MTCTDNFRGLLIGDHMSKAAESPCETHHSVSTVRPYPFPYQPPPPPAYMAQGQPAQSFPSASTPEVSGNTFEEFQAWKAKRDRKATVKEMMSEFFGKVGEVTRAFGEPKRLRLCNAAPATSSAGSAAVAIAVAVSAAC